MLTIADVLDAADIAQVRAGLERLAFADGRRTAGAAARKVKVNRQTDPNDPAAQALARFVRQSLERCALFSMYARPARWSKLLFSRYAAGDAYGLHLDDAIMPADDGARLRTDLSFTLFLSDPESYEGGALTIDGLDGEREVKPPAGGLALYPTGALHRLEPVTGGERLACVGWVQSLVRRGDERELLFDLARVRGGLAAAEAPLLLDKCIGGLLRLWAEP